MDFPYVILLCISSGVVSSSATIIIFLNFKKIFGCCIKKEARIEAITNPVNEWK